MHRAASRFFLITLVCAIALPALAAEGRIPIWQYPTAITAPGKYIVTRNIASLGGPVPIITIQTPDVDIDLNGFTLDASGSPAPVIYIIDDLVDVVIRNGNLVEGSASVERDFSAGTIGQRVVLEDIQSRRAQGTAIHLADIRNVVIRRVNIIDSGWHGIHLDRGALGGFVNGEIEHCSVRLPGGDGIHIDQGSALAIRHNRIEVAVNHGIHVAGLAGGGGSYACLIGENTISDADNVGIYLETVDGSKVYNNVISRGEQHGIVVDVASHDNFLLDNVVRQSGLGGAPFHPGPVGGHGIWVQGDRNHLERNTANDNDGCGLYFTGNGNTFGRNMARGNDPLGLWCAPCIALFPPDSCDQGAANATSQNNMIPNLF